MSSSISSGLSAFAKASPAAAEILASGISNYRAADQITELGFSTSEASVRRYRSAQLQLADLSSPQLPDAPRPVTPKWSAGIDVDRLAGTAEIRTRPEIVRPGGEDASLDDIRILREHGLDPDLWEVVSYRDSRWDQVTREGVERVLRAHRVSVRKRQLTGALDPAALEQILSAYTAQPRPSRGAGEGILATPLGDLQLGKPEGGGSTGIVERFARLTEEIHQRIMTEFGGRLKVLVVPVLGDLIEGSTSQGGRLLLDLGVTEQVRVVRRLLIHFLATLAPLADRVVVAVVPGNHGDTRRDRATTAIDNWDVEACVSAQDALALDPRFAHVEWAYPPVDELSLAVEVEGLVIGLTHGHTLSSADRMGRWLADQALGRQPVGLADVLFSGHFHSLRQQDLGGGRVWIQVPTIDGGSAWFVNRRGTASTPGLVSVELLAEAPHWRGLIHHV